MCTQTHTTQLQLQHTYLFGPPTVLVDLDVFYFAVALEESVSFVLGCFQSKGIHEIDPRAFDAKPPNVNVHMINRLHGKRALLRLEAGAENGHVHVQQR